MPARVTLAGLAVSTLAIAAAGLGLVTLAAVAGAGAWPWALAEHFHVHYLVLAIGCAGALAGLRRVALADGATLIALVNLVVVAPDLSGSRTAAPAGARRVRVLALNVLTGNRDHAAVARLIAGTAADVVVLVEVDRRWLDALAPALADYAGRIEHARTDNFGVAVYARGLLAHAAIEGGDEIPVARVELDGGLTLFAVHTLPPVSRAAASHQRAQLDALAARVRAVPGPRLVIGDLNATPWSAELRRFVAASGLRDSRAGFGVQATFPSWLGPFGIPIDHALVSRQVTVVDRWVGPAIGSDHLPIILDLAILP